MSNVKTVPARKMKPGDCFTGWKINHMTRFSCGVVKSISPFQVEVTVFPGPNEHNEIVDTEAQFTVEMTEKEYQEKYAAKARKVVEALRNEIQPDEIGYHEMDNHWLDCSSYSIADALDEMGCKPVGICTQIPPSYAVFMDNVKDVGVCVEDIKTGERFWCHWFLHSIEDAITEFEQIKYKEAQDDRG